MTRPGQGAYKDGGVGFVRSLDANGNEYVRVIQYLDDGLERKRSTFDANGNHVKTEIFGWSEGKAFVQETITGDSINLNAVMLALREQGYQP